MLEVVKYLQYKDIEVENLTWNFEHDYPIPSIYKNHSIYKFIIAGKTYIFRKYCFDYVLKQDGKVILRGNNLTEIWEHIHHKILKEKESLIVCAKRIRAELKEAEEK